MSGEHDPPGLGEGGNQSWIEKQILKAQAAAAAARELAEHILPNGFMVIPGGRAKDDEPPVG